MPQIPVLNNTKIPGISFEQSSARWVVNFYFQEFLERKYAGRYRTKEQACKILKALYVLTSNEAWLDLNPDFNAIQPGQTEIAHAEAILQKYRDRAAKLSELTTTPPRVNSPRFWHNYSGVAKINKRYIVKLQFDNKVFRATPRPSTSFAAALILHDALMYVLLHYGFINKNQFRCHSSDFEPDQVNLDKAHHCVIRTMRLSATQLKKVTHKILFPVPKVEENSNSKVTDELSQFYGKSFAEVAQACFNETPEPIDSEIFSEIDTPAAVLTEQILQLQRSLFATSIPSLNNVEFTQQSESAKKRIKLTC